MNIVGNIKGITKISIFDAAIIVLRKHGELKDVFMVAGDTLELKLFINIEPCKIKQETFYE